MKTLLLLLLLIAQISYGQSHYIDSTSHWHENAQYHSMIAPDSTHFQDYVYYINGDSTYNGHSYFQLLRTGIDSVVSPQTLGYSLIPINERIGLLREDITTGKVYFIPNTLSYESLLYDFSLTVGDTIPNSYGYSNCGGGEIYAADTFYFGGNIRKRLFSHATNIHTGGVRIFEGIGANCGLLGIMCIYFDGVYPCLMSYYNSTDTVEIINCSSFVSVDELQQRSLQVATISPNPFTSGINYTILKNDARVVSYSVLSPLGESVLEKKSVSQTTGTIDLASLASGIYFLRINVDGEQTVLRLVKE